MCIIIHKPAGIETINEDILFNSFENNPDGAGIAIIKKKETVILKGFLEFEDLFYAVESLKKSDNYVIHFRWATHGEISQANCHPFIVSSAITDLLKTETITTKKVLAHNGIIRIIPRKGISDTMEFVITNHHKINYNFLKTQDNNKFALIEQGKVHLIGSWLFEDGLFFSNDSYESIDFNFGTWETNKIQDIDCENNLILNSYKEVY